MYKSVTYFKTPNIKSRIYYWFTCSKLNCANINMEWPGFFIHNIISNNTLKWERNLFFPFAGLFLWLIFFYGVFVVVCPSWLYLCCQQLICGLNKIVIPLTLWLHLRHVLSPFWCHHNNLHQLASGNLVSGVNIFSSANWLPAASRQTIPFHMPF